MSIDQRPIDPREVIYSLRGLTRHLHRNARLLDRLYTDDGARMANVLRDYALRAEHWANCIEDDHTAQEYAA